MINIRKSLSVVLAVATIGTGIAATATPAAAWYYRPHYVGLGLAAAAVATGAAIAAANASPYYYGHCWRQPIVNPWGYVVGYNRVCR